MRIRRRLDRYTLMEPRMYLNTSHHQSRNTLSGFMVKVSGFEVPITESQSYDAFHNEFRTKWIKDDSGEGQKLILVNFNEVTPYGCRDGHGLTSLFIFNFFIWGPRTWHHVVTLRNFIDTLYNNKGTLSPYPPISKIKSRDIEYLSANMANLGKAASRGCVLISLCCQIRMPLAFVMGACLLTVRDDMQHDSTVQPQIFIINICERGTTYKGKAFG